MEMQSNIMLFLCFFFYYVQFHAIVPLMNLWKRLSTYNANAWLKNYFCKRMNAVLQLFKNNYDNGGFKLPIIKYSRSCNKYILEHVFHTKIYSQFITFQYKPKYIWETTFRNSFLSEFCERTKSNDRE